MGQGRVPQPALDLGKVLGGSWGGPGRVWGGPWGPGRVLGGSSSRDVPITFKTERGHQNGHGGGACRRQLDNKIHRNSSSN